MALYLYELDKEAQKLVMDYRDKGVLKESHKMRVTVAYGLERFWGEHLRLLSKGKQEEQQKGEFWRETWKTLVDIMGKAGVKVPNETITIITNRDGVRSFKTEDIRNMTDKLWDVENFSIEHQRVTLSVLTQLCDSLVWWTQRYQNSQEEKQGEQ
ncbi:hypothetical protein DSM106972_047790 [Dulcicalothrix desertica PCC 7102]|uniref:CRISPR type III-B/RAMP module-associated protein Cmr5 n=1 Tax=Dulcicalothrix desertica PCC 7102 TaxID=232991 RepID=A0A3S1ALS6_9CYAN|nr:hypothetical protein [Dulcicalothrix desertica]RUT03865.1 hypothetical protein DSM106972_047790 [Dulcicalothrix desertica PCC 7102]TWH43724.1 hypothetical protein CAL7102_07468 [Dulcicalothrix desertica PCC 7102]